MTGRKKIIDRERNFWSKVDIKSIDECWEFSSSKNKAGYARFWNGSKYMYAHRYSWELHNGRKVPEGILICHHCDNPSCVNPDHLFCGTYSDNQIDRSRKGRVNNAGCVKNQTKLYDEEWWLVRKLYISGRVSQRKIAKMFKVSQSVISLHLSGKCIHTRGPCPK